MKILIVTDAASPQINGVVRTLQHNAKCLRQFGHTVNFITPNDFRFRVPLLTYPEIKIALDIWTIGKKIAAITPDVVHIATEGSIGIAARQYCIKNDIDFTTSYHTNFPEYINARVSLITPKFAYKFFKWFHKPSKAVLVTTQSMKEELSVQGFNSLHVWGRGVDLNLFHPSKRVPSKNLTLINVGRVSVEKNLVAFLELHKKFPQASFIVVGDGPDRKQLEIDYPTVLFTGSKQGEELAALFAAADVFVFPSKTDTFGIVMIEANASGLPVAAYPVNGPNDFIEENVNGSLNDDLESAIVNCMSIDRVKCRQHVEENYSWEKCSRIFESVLKQIHE